MDKQTIKINIRNVIIVTTIKWIEMVRIVEMTIKILINSIQKTKGLEADHNPKINNKLTHIIINMWDLDTIIINKILNIRKNRANSRKGNQMLTLIVKTPIILLMNSKEEDNRDLEEEIEGNEGNNNLSLWERSSHQLLRDAI